MNEERSLAKEYNYESPVWNSLEETHGSYNDCLEHVIPNLTEHGMLLIASHNKDSVDRA